MGRRTLTAIGIAAVLSAGFLAGWAGGAVTPPAFLLVTQSPGQGATGETLLAILPTQGETLPAASVSVYVPAGYTLTLNLPPGTQIGGLIAPGATNFPMLTVADPAANTTDPCAPGTHAAVWQATLTVSGQPVVVHVYVDPTTGDETARGAYRLTYCQSLALFFVLEGIVTTPTAPGNYTWRAFVTPQAVGAPPDPNTVYELRAIIPIPHVIKAKVTYVARTRTLVVSGKVIAATAAEPDAVVHVERRKGTHILAFGTATTHADGSFTVKKVIPETKAPQTLDLSASAEVPPGPCTDPPLAPAGCLSQTAASTSTSFTARIPKRPPKPKLKKR